MNQEPDRLVLDSQTSSGNPTLERKRDSHGQIFELTWPDPDLSAAIRLPSEEGPPGHWRVSVHNKSDVEMLVIFPHQGKGGEQKYLRPDEFYSFPFPAAEQQAHITLSVGERGKKPLWVAALIVTNPSKAQ